MGQFVSRREGLFKLLEGSFDLDDDFSEIKIWKMRGTPFRERALTLLALLTNFVHLAPTFEIFFRRNQWPQT